MISLPFIGGLPGYLYDGEGKRRRALSPNARVHWRQASRVKRKDKDDVICAALAAGARGLRLERARVVVRLYFASRRRRDMDNATALVKGVLDGLVAAEVLTDDSEEVIGRPELELLAGDAEGYEVIIYPHGKESEFPPNGWRRGGGPPNGAPAG